jgi:hypothetical protein
MTTYIVALTHDAGNAKATELGMTVHGTEDTHIFVTSQPAVGGKARHRQADDVVCWMEEARQGEFFHDHVYVLAPVIGPPPEAD